MRVMELEGKTIGIDEDGFLANTEEWSEDVARALARENGIAELPKERLDILASLRAYYGEHHFFPITRSVCRSVHQPNNCVEKQFGDPVEAWKIAGLPNPGEEVIAFKSWDPLGF